jgi:hypothetical protein
MKKVFIYSLILIFFSLLFCTEKASADNKYYIIFDNLDVITNTDGVLISNAWDSLYYAPVMKRAEYAPYVLRVPFNDATLSTYDVTKFDLAVFDMGDNPLNYTTSGGISVLSKIKAMEAAGKRVIIIGRSLLWRAFHTQPNQDVQDFFNQYLGVDDVFRMSTSHTQGNTTYFEGYTVIGPDGDPVSNEARKWANCRRKSTSDNQWWDPWKYTTDIEAFKVRKDSNIFVMEWASKVIDDIQIINYPETDTILGVRAITPHSKMVFWDFGFEYMNAWISISLMQDEYWIAFQWLLREFPSNEPSILEQPTPLNFGGVKINTDTVRGIKITNLGRKPLTVNDMSIEVGDPFSIVNPQPLPFTLQPNDTHTVFIKFSPKQEVAYEDNLYISSNSYLSNDTYVELKGTGGKEDLGPVPDAPDSVDFGTVKYGHYKVDTITVRNIGTADFWINKKEITNSAGGSFTFDKTDDSRAPISIGPDSSHQFHMRFFPVKPDSTYIGEIKLSLGISSIQFITIKLVGRSADTIPGIKFDNVALKFNFDTLKIKKPAQQTLTITNNGNAELVLKSSSGFTFNDSSAYSFVEGTANFPIIMEPADAHDLQINFTPPDTGSLSGVIKLVTNIKTSTGGDSTFYISLMGVGIEDTVGVEDNTASTSDGLFVMKAMPNPVQGHAVLQYTLNSIGTKQVNMYLVDVQGREVSKLINNEVSPGEYRLNLDASALNLAAGAYYVIANVGGSQAKLPIIIIR